MMLRVLAHTRDYCSHALNLRAFKNKTTSGGAVDVSDPSPVGCWHKRPDDPIRT